MLDDIHALVQFSEAGSVVRAADRLHRTPSAVTRQIQRLEAALGAELLDRTVKPPRLTPLGVRIVEQSREVLRRVDDLRSLAAPGAEPSGLLRIGVSHALADSALVQPIRRLTNRFPKLRLRLLSDLTADLLTKLRSGELDAAIVLLPYGRATNPAFPTRVVATDRMVIVKSAAVPLVRVPQWQDIAETPWVLNPPGCLLRSALLEMMDRAGTVAKIAAEIHNMHLQLAFVQAGHGLGLLPERFVRRNSANDAVRIITPKSFELRITVAVVTSGPLGSLEAAARHLESSLSEANESWLSARTEKQYSRRPSGQEWR